MERPQEKIIIREADLGPVIARADHQDRAIEVNCEIFYQLPPMVQEFVLCHEVCHLRHNEWDEGRTNQLASDLFMQRASGESDRKRRAEFLSYLDGNGGYSNFAWGALIAAIPSMVSVGYGIYGVIKDRNSGWYSWDDTTKRSNLDTMLTASFEQSRRSRSRSAADYFWEHLKPYTHKDDTLTQFLNRSDNAWVPTYIARYQKKYGFGFEEVTPIDLTAYPLAIVAIGAVLAVIVYLTIKKRKK